MPLADVATGRYTVEAVVVEAGGAQAAFGRNYFALRPVTLTPTAAPPADPAAAPASTPAATTPGGN
jgi:hypothetical protein